MTASFDVLIAGAGITGLGVGMTLARDFSGLRVAILEKEDTIAAHQTGHNSGVIHSGLYYRPGSAKARLCKAGRDELIQFCQAHDIRHEICGKVVIATREEQLPALAELFRRGSENGLFGLSMLSSAAVRDFEPHVQCIGAIHVPSTGIVDFREVARAYSRVFSRCGGKLFLKTEVKKIERPGSKTIRFETNNGRFESRLFLNCAGLYSDRVARLSGTNPHCMIVPFRGEYYRLRRESAHLVKNLIYPVPDPRLPFLGVHFTRRIGGEIEAGPNAVLAFAREGYTARRISLRDTFETLAYTGFHRLVAKYWRTGIEEMARSFSKSLFTQSLQELIPAVTRNYLETGGAGVRAQALGSDGKLIDDFLPRETENAIHVLNAPSPAATSSLAIARHIASMAGRKLGSH
ncbi:MAG: L-2-hydroxyglutarate oxidase [Syntrophobacteraceae bacterium]